MASAAKKTVSPGPAPRAIGRGVARSGRAGTVRVGIGGWTFEPWRGTFYPPGLARAEELAYASRQLTSIEINGTFYRTQTPATFAKWAAAVPDGFVFAVKGPRTVGYRSVLAEAEPSIARFLASGVGELGAKLGPILWQFPPSKRFDADDVAALLGLLPAKLDGRRLRHAIEPRHPSFVCREFIDLLARHGAACVVAEHATYPLIADATADFVYARLQMGRDDLATGYSGQALDAWAGRLLAYARGEVPSDLGRIVPWAEAKRRPRDVFAYVIHEGKLRAPAAAMALIRRVAAADRRPAGLMER